MTHNQPTNPFALHPRLAADTNLVTTLPLCHVLLMNDARYLWLILVPALPNLVEIVDLSPADQTQLMAEVAHASRALQNLASQNSSGQLAEFPLDKINVGALGNLVPQLHVHVVGRHQADPAWPGPIWGHSPAVARTSEQTQALVATVQTAFQESLTTQNA